MIPTKVIAGKRDTGSDLRYTLKVNSIGLPVRYHVGCERSKRVSNDSRFFDLRNCKELPENRPGMNAR